MLEKDTVKYIPNRFVEFIKDHYRDSQKDPVDALIAAVLKNKINPHWLFEYLNKHW